VSNSEAYRIVKQIGNGLTGPVFLADAASGRVAIRQFQSSSEAGGEEWLADLQHFLQGGRQGALLHHPRIVEIFEVIDEGGNAYIASEFVAAETCEALMARETPIPEQAHYMLRLMAIALDYAHQNGITHGDLKPSNIFVLPMRDIKISDFAISPRARRFAGSPPHEWFHGYLSPEHLSAPETIGPRSDQYSLAAIGWHFYTGCPPSLGIPPTRGQIPPLVEAVLARALSRDSANRYLSCLQLVDALDASLAAPSVALVEKKVSKLIYASLGGIAALLLFLALLVSAANKSKTSSPPVGPASLTHASINTEKVHTTTAGGSALGRGEPDYAKPRPAPTVAVVRESVRTRAAVPQPYPITPDPPRERQSLPPATVGAVGSRFDGPPPPQAHSMELVLRSRDHKIESGISFSYRDPELGEMAHGDLTAVVESTGPLPRGKLTLDWMVDEIPMGAPQIVVPNRPIPYGNEPTPGSYKVTLKLDGNPLKSGIFRITK